MVCKNAPRKIGLALGGGAALGAAHIGVLKYLEEHSFEITHIAGTSIGALVGGAYACGVPIIELIKFARRARWTKLTRLAVPRMGLFANDKLKEQIIRLIGDKNFKDADFPFAAIATCLETGEQVVINQGQLVDAILASCAVPGIFEPVELNSKLLCDGGVVNIVPDDAVWEMGAEHVIAVDLTSKSMGNDRPDSLLGVIYKSQNILTRRTLAFNEKTIVITPETKGYSAAGLNNYRTLVRIGYKAAMEKLIAIWPEINHNG